MSSTLDWPGTVRIQVPLQIGRLQPGDREVGVLALLFVTNSSFYTNGATLWDGCCRCHLLHCAQSGTGFGLGGDRNACILGTYTPDHGGEVKHYFLCIFKGPGYYSILDTCLLPQWVCECRERRRILGILKCRQQLPCSANGPRYEFENIEWMPCLFPVIIPISPSLTDEFNTIMQISTKLYSALMNDMLQVVEIKCSCSFHISY